MQAVERRWTLAAALLGILVTLSPTAVLASAPAVDRITVEVDCQPDAQTPRAFVCRAKVVDLESNEVLAAPKVTFLAGSPATVQTGITVKDDAGNDALATFKMEVAVTDDMTMASYSSRMLLGEEVLNEQTFRFRLPAEPSPEVKVSKVEVPAAGEDPVTLSLRNGKVREVLAQFASLAKLNLRMHDDVAGVVTVELRDVPWRVALEEILRIDDLEMTVAGGYLLVAPKGKLAEL